MLSNSIPASVRKKFYKLPCTGWGKKLCSWAEEKRVNFSRVTSQQEILGYLKFTEPVSYSSLSSIQRRPSLYFRVSAFGDETSGHEAFFDD